MTCSEKEPMFCINLNYPQSITHIAPTQLAQDSIRFQKLKAALLSSQTSREKIIRFILWSPGFTDFMVVFILWTFLTRPSVKVLEKYRPSGETDV